MKVLVTGGSGFVGTTLCAALMAAGHQVSALCRSQGSAKRLPPGAGAIIGDPGQPGEWQEQAAAFDAFVNLAGASIFNRWSADYKALIRSSRVMTTRNLVQAMGDGPKTLVSASAVGYYGPHGDEELDESSPPGGDFLAQVCRDWEAEALAARDKGARVVNARFGIVLGPDGGALGQMLPIFKKGLGGPLGSGKQWLSWIHAADLTAALIFMLQGGLEGPFNCTAPQPVTNREFSKALGRTLGRPAFFTAPGFAIKLALGEMGSILLTGQRALPRALMEAGFSFRFQTIDAALRDLLA